MGGCGHGMAFRLFSEWNLIAVQVKQVRLILLIELATDVKNCQARMIRSLCIDVVDLISDSGLCEHGEFSGS
jgi:hypothetical protein